MNDYLKHNKLNAFDKELITEDLNLITEENLINELIKPNEAVFKKSMDLMITQLNIYDNNSSKNNPSDDNSEIIGTELTSIEQDIINTMCELLEEQSDPEVGFKYIGNYTEGEDVDVLDENILKNNSQLSLNLSTVENFIKPKLFISEASLIKRFYNREKYGTKEIKAISNALDGLNTKMFKIHQSVIINGVRDTISYDDRFLFKFKSENNGIFIKLNPIFRSGLAKQLNYIPLPKNLKEISYNAYGKNTTPPPPIRSFIEFLYAQKHRNRCNSKYKYEVTKGKLIERIAKKQTRKDRIEKALADVFRVSAALPIIEKIDHRINDKNEDIYIFTFNMKDNN